MDDHSIGIGQNNCRFKVAQLLKEDGHLVPGAGDQVGQTRAAFLKVEPPDKFWRRRLGRVQAVGVDAAAPRLCHHIIFLLAQSATHLLQNSMCVAGVLSHRYRPSVKNFVIPVALLVRFIKSNTGILVDARIYFAVQVHLASGMPRWFSCKYFQYLQENRLAAH